MADYMGIPAGPLAAYLGVRDRNAQLSAQNEMMAFQRVGMLQKIVEQQRQQQSIQRASQIMKDAADLPTAIDQLRRSGDPTLMKMAADLTTSQLREVQTKSALSISKKNERDVERAEQEQRNRENLANMIWPNKDVDTTLPPLAAGQTRPSMPPPLSPAIPLPPVQQTPQPGAGGFGWSAPQGPTQPSILNDPRFQASLLRSGHVREAVSAMTPNKESYKTQKISPDGKHYIQVESFDAGRTWRQIPNTAPIPIRDATGASNISVSLGDQSRGEVNVQGFGMKNRNDLANGINRSSGAITDLRTFLDRVSATPNATGVRGQAGAITGGIAEQLTGSKKAGDALSRSITGGSQAQVQEIQTRATFLLGRLMPIATGEDGRFSDREREMAKQAFAALNIERGPTQVKSAARTIIKLEILSQQRAMRALGMVPRHDLTTENGVLAQAAEFAPGGTFGREGLTPADAVELVKEMRRVWGQGE